MSDSERIENTPTQRKLLALTDEVARLREALTETTRALDEISDESDGGHEVCWQAVRKTIYKARAALAQEGE